MVVKTYLVIVGDADRELVVDMPKGAKILKVTKDLGVYVKFSVEVEDDSATLVKRKFLVTRGDDKFTLPVNAKFVGCTDAKFDSGRYFYDLGEV